MLKKLHLFLWIYRQFLYFKFCLKNNAHISAITKFNLIRRGFFPNKELIYDFSRYPYCDYVSDYQENFKANHINKFGETLVNNKLIFPIVIAPFVKSPKTFALIENGRLVQYGNTSENFDNWERLIKYINDNKPLVLKPIEGDGGIGIIKISKAVSGGFLVNQKELTEPELIEKLKKLHHYMISEFVTQAEYSRRIYPHSVNTVRILTMIDSTSMEPFIAGAAHRIGNNYSYPVDNCAMGGFTARIDPQTGRIGKAVAVKNFKDKLQWHTFHPDTGNPIEGIIVPRWEDIKEKVLQMAKNLSVAPYLGWDIVVTDDGFTVLEANEGADLKLHQVHEPLLIYPRIKQFYQNYKVI